MPVHPFSNLPGCKFWPLVPCNKAFKLRKGAAEKIVFNYVCHIKTAIASVTRLVK